MIVSAVCLFCLLAYLVGERVVLRRRLKSIPLRVAVTGTRGKSSVVRLTAAALRASGRRVLAKTTGSRPVLIHPDGSEREIDRRGPASILEGKAFLKAACRLGVDTVVAELMSIQPECLRAESRRLLQPSLLAVTNIRLDHRDVMGRSREEIARSLAEAVPRGGRVFMLQEDAHPAVEEVAGKRGAALTIVPEERGRSRRVEEGSRRSWDFPGNTRLALALAAACGVGRRTALKAMSSARPDSGAFRSWRVRAGCPSRAWHCASAFAANEPESTAVLLDRLRKAGFLRRAPRVALLNLRDDRPDRTLQWLAAARSGFFREFDSLLVAGASRMAARMWRKEAAAARLPLALLPPSGPAAVMDGLASRHKTGGSLFGAGNIGGLGRDLVAYWERDGADDA
ncbi:MAG: poly-gamma-glutamate synthase PgsB [Candidatus Aminicenantes bacterium]|nr:poly-gamma-glutamate synthase PgsB [Candidatus Aminicenantes bacterium]